jgi:SAM-dependent methyltransferase
MTELDLKYIKEAIDLGHFGLTTLEVGAAEDWCCVKPRLEERGISTTSVDIKDGKYVDHLVDLEQEFDSVQECLGKPDPFDSILCFNVLEHTFSPTTVLDNLLGLLAPGGHLLISTPLCWPLHSYPFDFWRPLPNFYEQYAKRNKLMLLKERFHYLGYGIVSNYTSGEGRTGFPPPTGGRFKFVWGRLIHKLFNTFGREYLYPNHLALALTYRTKQKTT